MNPHRSSLTSDLRDRLAALKEQGLERRVRELDTPQAPRVRVEGVPLLNFSSNDYLGLAGADELREAACRATRDYGAGAGASRLVCGSLPPHRELEEALRSFKGAEGALAFSSGYAAALGTIPALVGPGDTVILDRLAHACLVDAARLSGARLRVFPHNDAAALEALLERLRARSEPAPAGRPDPAILIVTESVFSMDGDQAPLPALAALKERYGAWLMVDEAHATGLYGPRRRGLVDALGLADRVDVQFGTLSKAVGASGGYVCGARVLIDYLVNRARSFVYSTAPVPAAAAAAAAGLRLIAGPQGESRCALLRARVRQFWQQALAGTGTAALPEDLAVVPAAIVPLIVGREEDAVTESSGLRQQGLFVPAIRYPSVARGAARLRLTFSAAHAPEDVHQLAEALRGRGLHHRLRFS